MDIISINILPVDHLEWVYFIIKHRKDEEKKTVLIGMLSQNIFKIRKAACSVQRDYEESEREWNSYRL